MWTPCMTGNFGTVIVHGGDEIDKMSTQMLLSSATESSPALEHVENLSASGTGNESAAPQYSPHYLYLMLI